MAAAVSPELAAKIIMGAAVAGGPSAAVQREERGGAELLDQTENSGRRRSPVK